MSSAWAFAFLLLYPALQVPLLWVVVRHYGLRNDDGPRDPVGFATGVREDASGDGGPGAGGSGGPTAGRCSHCGLANDPAYEYCRDCLAGLS